MKCFVLKCESKKALARVRQYVFVHKIKSRTLNNCVVVYDEPLKKSWGDIGVIEAVERTDVVGNIYYENPAIFCQE